RDYLSANLNIIEEQLVLVAVEFEVPNDHGAKGFIDILERDRCGHHVVIELKRSDQAGRTALHELHKYVALLRVHHGIGYEQVRSPRALKKVSTLLARVDINDHVEVLADTHDKEKGEFQRSAIYVAMARPSQEQADRLEARFEVREEVENPDADQLEVQTEWEG